MSQRALHVVLATQRVHADAGLADVAGRHREVGHAHDHGRALAVLGDAEAVVDGGVAAGGVEARRGRAASAAGTPVTASHRLGRVALLGDELAPALEGRRVAALGDEGLVDQALGDDDVRHRVDHGDVGAGPQRQVVVGLDVRRAVDQVDAARVDDDQLGAVAQAPLHVRGEHRVGVGRVGADDHDHVGVLDGVEVLGAGGGAEAWSSGRSRWASGRRGRRCRRCCCRRRRAPASAPGRSLRWCSARR